MTKFVGVGGVGVAGEISVHRGDVLRALLERKERHGGKAFGILRRGILGLILARGGAK